jgi:hypothetical protein
MASEKLQLIVGAKDQASKKLGNIQNKIIGIGTAYLSWQAATQIIKTSIDAFGDYEQSLIGIEHLAQTTGRNITQIYGAMNDQLYGMADKAAMASTMLKGLTTTLDVDQISDMTSAIRDASLAMGEDFNVQLPLIIKAIKQLNPAILDNIGVTVRLDKVNQKIKDGFYGTRTAVNEVTQQHAIFTEIMKQTAQFAGMEEKALEGTKGAMIRLDAATKDLSVSIGEFLSPEINEATGALLTWTDKLDLSFQKASLQKGFWARWATLFATAYVTMGTAAGELYTVLYDLEVQLAEQEKQRLAAINETTDAYNKQRQAVIDSVLASESAWRVQQETHAAMQDDYLQQVDDALDEEDEYWEEHKLHQIEIMNKALDEAKNNYYDKLTEAAKDSFDAQKAMAQDLVETMLEAFAQIVEGGKVQWDKLADDLKSALIRKGLAAGVGALVGGPVGAFIGSLFKTGKADVEW